MNLSSLFNHYLILYFLAQLKLFSLNSFLDVPVGLEISDELAFAFSAFSVVRSKDIAFSVTLIAGLRVQCHYQKAEEQIHRSLILDDEINLSMAQD